MNNTHKTVAKLIRLEKSKNKDDLFIVFEVIDEDFKQRIKSDWLVDIELEIIGKDLAEKEK